MTPGNWAAVRQLVDWLDSENERTDHETAARVMKIGEEFGEVVQAYIGMVGQNPRKGRTHTAPDVVGELCDVIVTAAVAMHLFTVDPAGALDAKLRKIRARVGVGDEPPVEVGSIGALTGRHLEMLRLVANGLGSHEIAERTGMSRNGVISTLQRAYRALGVHDRGQAVGVAMVLGLIRPSEVQVPAGVVEAAAGGEEAA